MLPCDLRMASDLRMVWREAAYIASHANQRYTGTDHCALWMIPQLVIRGFALSQGAKYFALRAGPPEGRD